MQRWVHGMIVGISLGLSVLSAGCDGNGAGSDIPTKTPRDKSFPSLTPAELTQYCADVEAWMMSGPYLTGNCNDNAWGFTYQLSLTATTESDDNLRAFCTTVYT